MLMSIRFLFLRFSSMFSRVPKELVPVCRRVIGQSVFHRTHLSSTQFRSLSLGLLSLRSSQALCESKNTTQSPTNLNLNAATPSSPASREGKKSTPLRKRMYLWFALVAASAALIATTQVPFQDSYVDWALDQPEKRLRISLAKWCVLLDQCLIAVYLQISTYLSQVFGAGYSLNFVPLTQYVKDITLPYFLGGVSKVSYDEEITPDEFDFVTRVEVFGTNGRRGMIYIYRKINEKELARLGGDLAATDISNRLDSLMEGYVPVVQLFPTPKLTPFDRMRVHKAMEDDLPGQLLHTKFASLHIEDTVHINETKLILCDNRKYDFDSKPEVGFENIGITYFEEPPKRKKWLGIW